MGLSWRLVRDGAAVDPGVAEDHAELERLRRRTMAGLLDGIDEGSLRPEMTLDRAIDTMLIIASPSAYETLVRQGATRWTNSSAGSGIPSSPRCSQNLALRRHLHCDTRASRKSTADRNATWWLLTSAAG
jgi:hypothetical protein